VLKLAPDNVSALNNLAYLLAVHRKSPKEALPLAERAYAKSKSAPITDTLGWIQHLLGNDKDAEPLLLSAVKMSPNHPEILLHSAIVLAANGKRTEASQLLLRAEKASPALARGDDARGCGSVWTHLPSLPDSLHVSL
jgi:Flp pilus assembly protein TadD